jgi:glutamine---fructose-6-phosphate transaminase (isomerizing)
MSDDRSWYTDDYPELRDGPPWVTEEMILSEPALPAAIVGSPAPEAGAIHAAIHAAVEAGEPVVVTGCGTSEHGSMAVALQLADHLPGAWVESRQAFDAAIWPRSGGIAIGVSHDGGTPATARALAAARAAGATTAAITAVPGSVSAEADHVLVTPAHDDSWCHTVAYASSILAGAAIAGSPGAERLTAGAQGAIAARPAIAEAAKQLLPGRRILTAGFGADEVGARELALKIEEGARIPSTAHHLETLLHGHLAGCDADTTALVILNLEPRGGEAHQKRVSEARAAVGRIGIPTVVLDTELGLPAAESPAEALLTGAVALQLLTLELAHLAGTNPDLIRREQAAYREAAAKAEHP